MMVNHFQAANHRAGPLQAGALASSSTANGRECCRP
jgi:hypothetical protein